MRRGMALSLDHQCRLAGLPVPEPEYQFAHKKRLTTSELAAIGQEKSRGWKLDYAFVPYRLAVEVEGGFAIGGRHTSVGGFLKDMEKYNALALLGWRLLRVTPRQVANGQALRVIELAVRPDGMSK